MVRARLRGVLPEADLHAAIQPVRRRKAQKALRARRRKAQHEQPRDPLRCLRKQELLRICNRIRFRSTHFIIAKIRGDCIHKFFPPRGDVFFRIRHGSRAHGPKLCLERLPAVVIVHGWHIKQVAPAEVVDLLEAVSAVEPDAVHVQVALFKRQAQMPSFFPPALQPFYGGAVRAEHGRGVSFAKGRKQCKLGSKLHGQLGKGCFGFIACRRQKRFFRRKRVYACVKRSGKSFEVFQRERHPRGIGMPAEAGKEALVFLQRRMQVNALNRARRTRKHALPLGKEHHGAVIPFRKL